MRWGSVGLGDAALLVAGLPVLALVGLAAEGHEAAPFALEVGDAGTAQDSGAVATNTCAEVFFLVPCRSIRRQPLFSNRSFRGVGEVVLLGSSGLGSFLIRVRL